MSRIRLAYLAVALAFAAVGCSDEGATTPPPSGPSPLDPMQIGSRDLPRTDPTEVSPINGAAFPQPNATAFETAKALSGSGSDGSDGNSFGRPVGTAGSVPSGAAPPGGPAAAPQMPDSDDAQGESAAPPTTPNPGQSDPSSNPAAREIVEADIVQAQGDILYVLNRYRGLVLIDMSMPDSPFVRGRVPFQAQPVDMYVREGKAYVVMSDYFSYWQFDGDSDPFGFHGSQVLVVDVQDTSRPEVSGSFNIAGEVTDTRIVGDVLYAVSKRNPQYWRYDTQDWEDTTWVVSIDLANPAAIRKVAEKEFPGAANLIQVYETALSVAAIDPNYYLVDEDNARQTKITYVDISDPRGEIVVGGSAYVPGAVQDKFKMDLSKGQLRVLSQDWYWDNSAPGTLTVLDATEPGKLTQRAQLAIANDVASGIAHPNATRFAGDDLFVNLCWWTSSSEQCRMDLYDLSDPSNPTRADALSVNSSVQHFEVRGDRLIALGRDTFNYQVQISLFDVADLRTARQLSTVSLGQYTGSEAQSDYKALKVLPELDMILLPLTWVESPNSSSYRSRSGAQIVDWNGDALQVRGRIAQNGYVERALPMGDRLVSVSTRQLQVIDATDRDRPVQTASLFLVRDVVDVFDIGGHQVQLAAAEDDQTYRFFVLPFGEDDMAKSLVELPVDLNVTYQMRSGNFIYVMGFDTTHSSQIIRTADFTNPLSPRLRGEYRLSEEIQHIYSGAYRSYWSFYDYYWNPNAGLPLENQLLPVTTRTVHGDANGRRYYKNLLRLIDLRDPDRPQLAAGSLPMPDYPFVNKVGHGKLLYSTHTEPALDANGNPKKYHERYFLDRVDASDPASLKALPKVNIPGRLVDVDASGTLLYTVDYQWDEHGQRRNSFNVLKLENDVATLVTVLPVGDEIDRARYLDREVWLTTHSYPWFGRNDDTPDSRQPYTRLTRLRFTETGQLMSEDRHDVSGYHFDLLDVEDSRVYLASSYPTGLLVLDVSDFANPRVLGASRTIGYVSKLIARDDALYLPMGSYGVRRVPVN